VNEFKNRKVPNCIKKVTNIEGELVAIVETKKVWDFEIPGDIDSKLVLIVVPSSECLVRENKQDIPSHLLHINELRGYSPAVWSAKGINYSQGKGWLTNSEIEIKKNIKYNSLDSFMNTPTTDTIFEKFLKFFKINPNLME